MTPFAPAAGKTYSFFVSVFGVVTPNTETNIKRHHARRRRKQTAQAKALITNAVCLTLVSGSPTVSTVIQHWPISRQLNMSNAGLRSKKLPSPVSIKAGQAHVTVSKMLGHSSPAITAQIYAHALDESKSGAIAGLSERLRQTC